MAARAVARAGVAQAASLKSVYLEESNFLFAAGRFRAPARGGGGAAGFTGAGAGCYGLVEDAGRPIQPQIAGKRMATQNISSLNLSAAAKKAAETLLEKYPDTEFTSGRRDLKDQARAMASNVVKKRDWIKNTYTCSAASKACQKWVDDHPEAKSQADIAAGLLDTLKGLGGQAGAISKHLTGDAFDVQPVTKDADAIKKFIKSLPGNPKFLDHEGGLCRWHVQF